jgi:peptidoglycan/xylan/chitin deacetylase (PgdA/CDA1 family)
VLPLLGLAALLLSFCGAPPATDPEAEANLAATLLPPKELLISPTPAPPTSTPAATATLAPLPSATPSPIPLPTEPPTPAPLAAAAALRGPFGPNPEIESGYVPILMYHYVRTVDPEQDPLGYRLSVTPAVFAEQMAWLKENGFNPIRLVDLTACLRGVGKCPPKPVVLTFDDGYADNYTDALPVLQQYGFKATFFIVPNFVDAPAYMTWAQLAELRDQGMEIASHTMTHLDLTRIGLERAREEIEQARVVLEERMGVPIVTFSYPAGKYDGDVVELTRQTGYASAVTTNPQRTLALMYELPRQRVLGGEPLASFAALLSGAPETPFPPEQMLVSEAVRP